MAKGGLARERFKAKQQYNRIVGQLNQLRGMGYSTDDIREAGPNAWQTLVGGGPQTQVVTDSDTVESIANQNGVGVPDVLSANPDVKQFKTGMVVNVPRPGSEEWRVQNAYGGGLPSNAALGGTTNNPQGLNAYQQSERTSVRPPAPVNANNRYATGQAGNPLGDFFSNLFGGGPQQQPFQRTPQGIRPATGQAQNPLAGLFSGGPQTQPYTRGPGGVLPVANTTATTRPGAPATTVQPRTPQPIRPTSIPTTYPGGFRRWVDEEMGQINSPTYTPNDVTVKYLQKLGLIEKQAPQPAYSSYSGYGGYRRGRGGRGGGGGGGGRVPNYNTGRAPQPQERMPAFSSGGGFNGLVNWRL